jgi:hypothetical protein
MPKALISNPAVAAHFNACPKAMQARLLKLRELILDVANGMPEVGPLEETLKWGQPAYLTSATGSGSLIRIDQVQAVPGRYAMVFHCQTTLVDTFKEMYRDELKFEKNRAIVFDEHDVVPVNALRHCIALALTYHLDKKRQSR